MKFGDTFMEYLHGDQEWFLDKCSHVEYKRLKKVLKSCRTCRLNNSYTNECECKSCPRKIVIDLFIPLTSSAPEFLAGSLFCCWTLKLN